MGNQYSHYLEGNFRFESEVISEGQSATDGKIYQSKDREDFSNVPDNMYANFQVGVGKSPHGSCLGYRQMHNGEAAAEYSWYTYNQVNDKLHLFGRGLTQLNMLSGGGDGFFGIFMKNRPEWIIAQQGVWSRGGVVVPIYDISGPNAVEYIINQTNISTILCTSVELKTLIQAKKQCGTLQNVILAGEKTAAVGLEAEQAGLKLFTFDDIINAGEGHEKLLPCPGKKDDLAMLIYTSGTTGPPKGAMITHNAMVIGSQTSTYRTYGFIPNLIFFSYLPLPHIYENLGQASIYFNGGAVGFFQGEAVKLVEDLVALRPTVFFAVPRVLNKIYDRIVSVGLNEKSMKASLFKKALLKKMDNLNKKGTSSHAVYDALIFNKVRAKLGLDRCIYIVCAGAPVVADVLQVLRIALLCPIVEGYGSTESGNSTMTSAIDIPNGYVGVPNGATEMKLVSVPEMGYNITDTVHATGGYEIKCAGRGEICMRGPTLFKGYYKAPDLTAAALDSDGWYHSGDIGIWSKDGRLKIVDRKKHIFKLSHGIYISPEIVENVLTISPLVDGAFVYGDSLHSHLVAIIVPNIEAMTRVAGTHGIKFSTEADLYKSDKIRKLILEDIEGVSRKAKLSGVEIVKEITLRSEPFPAVMLTPTMKVKRNCAKQFFLECIQDMYQKSGDCIAGKNILQG